MQRITPVAYRPKVSQPGVSRPRCPGQLISGLSRAWRTLVRDEQGQDLVEYSLLLAFVCLAGAALFIGMGQTTKGLWTTVNSRLAAANQSNAS